MPARSNKAKPKRLANAKRLVEALGLQARGGVVRVSIAHYNTPAEMAHLITHLDAAIDAALDTKAALALDHV